MPKLKLKPSPRLLWGILILALPAPLGWALLFPRTPDLPTYGRVPPFHLTDQTGQPFPDSSLKGRPWIADFIFTSCAGTCPLMTEKMVVLDRTLSPEIHLVSFSVDPARDTPEILSQYANRYGAKPNRWHFLTGEPDRIAKLVSEGFRLSYAEGGGPAEPITHSVRFVLVDREGSIRGYYDSTDPKTLQQLIRDAHGLYSPPSDG